MRIWFKKSVRFDGFKFKDHEMVIGVTGLDSGFVKINSGSRTISAFYIDWVKTMKNHWDRENEFFELKEENKTLKKCNEKLRNIIKRNKK